jgi:hypothetical protein
MDKMERPKLKINRLKNKEIELYCQSVEEILIKINNRKSSKKILLKENNQTPEQELMDYE